MGVKRGLTLYGTYITNVWKQSDQKVFDRKKTEVSDLG
jgi:hypothetical protein